jgi:uncharacterized membrane protein
LHKGTLRLDLYAGQYSELCFNSSQIRHLNHNHGDVIMGIFGEIFGTLYILVIISTLIYLVVLIARFVRIHERLASAHERTASALETIAAKSRDETQP